MGITLQFLLLSLAPAAPRGGDAAREPRIVVSELFHELLDGWATGGGDIHGHLRPVWWWSRTSRLPSLSELNRTILSSESVFNTSTRLCAADLHLNAHSAPRDFCVHPIRGLHDGAFDQYAHELHLLSRYLQIAPICDPRQHDEGGELACGADIVVVPSLLFHHTMAVGRTWAWLQFLQANARRHWQTVARLYYRHGKPGPLIVVPEVYPWDSMGILLKVLARMPRKFASRVVIPTTMSNLPTKLLKSTFGDGKRASGWQVGAELELRRRDALLNAAATGQAWTWPSPSIGAPLLVTVPTPVGIARAVDWWAPTDHFKPAPRSVAIAWSASLQRTGKRFFGRKGKQYVRPQVVAALRAAGAHCTGDECVLCVDQTESCVTPENQGLFRRETGAAFCVEPPGDVLGRSHTHLAIQTGCIPVLVEGGHLAYPHEPTWWAWRSPPRRRDGASANLFAERCSLREAVLRGLKVARAKQGEDSSTTALDYSGFSVLLPESVAASNMSDWPAQLVALARDEQTMRQLRERMRHVAPSFLYAPTDCGAPRCDAFARFRELIARAWRQIRALEQKTG
jgi:hypothetical protein